ncbi:MAG TPA: ATP-binding protein [Actinomycetes bacterium]|jgi:signal transduction histidine kinase|nr:ATP-binding protein [Actinomycetes bacterium]
MLAHELRRRMAAVRVVGEAIALLREQGQDPAPMLELLLGEIEDLDDLAGEVLGDRPAAEPGGVVDVAAAAEAAARTVAVARGASVRVRAEGRAEVDANPTMLRQALENLIDNAALHGGPGGVEVGVHPDPAAGQVEVVVADQGHRAAARGGSLEDREGHGIGLFVVRRFLDEAGGRSFLTRGDGGGTLAGLRLPLRPAAEPDPLDTAVNT